MKENSHIIDHQRATREYRKLGIPDGYFDPTECPLNQAKYFNILTERASGKTTNVLLYGMCCNKLFGTVIQYIRQTEQMLAPKNARNLMDTIITNGYIQKLTDGKYDNAVYKARRWYYCRYGEDGKVAEQDTDPFMVCLSLDQTDVYKSSYNAPYGDFIVFDEYCARRHQPDEFILFCDMLSSIIRTRVDGITIWMLGNTLDRYEYYFDELEIADYVKYMQIGEHMLINTSKGTPIYIEIYSPKKRTLKDKVNKIFFGFNNSKLNAITGEDWLIVPYQHIDRFDDGRDLIDNNHFIIYEKNLVQLEVVNSEKYGLHIIAHKSTNWNRTDAVYYTVDHLKDIRYRFRYGHSKVDSMIWTLYDRQKFFYATNSDAAVVQKYVSVADKISA